MLARYLTPLIAAQSDGNPITGTTAVSALPAQAVWTMPGNFIEVPGQTLRIFAAGKISCAVTTPGTARFDVRIGSAVVFDGLAINLNVAGRTNVAWWLEILLTARTIGSAASFIGHGLWTSQAGVGAGGDTVSAPGSFVLPYNSTPAVGATFDSTASAKLHLQAKYLSRGNDVERQMLCHHELS